MDYKVKDCVQSTICQDALEIAEAPLDWNQFSGKSVLITGGGG